MGESPRGTLPPAGPPEDRLNSWKEIAAHFDRDVTTVQRWEKREEMPVHRHLHDKMGSIYASRAELDTWARGRNLRTTPENSSPSPPTPSLLPPPPLGARIRWRLVLPIAAVVAVLAAGARVWVEKTEYFWQSPITGGRFQLLTDFDGMDRSATVSRDGRFVAFLSDRDGQTDVWVTQAGSSEFHNLTRGRETDLINPQARSLGFSPDASVVTFWNRKQSESSGSVISVWAAPILGGQPKPYLEGVGEFDWSHDGSRLVYHTTESGDPIFVSDGSRRPEDQPIFTAPAGTHCHFPLWAPDGAFIYFVRGSFPDNLDIWRIPSTGGTPERITSHNARVSHPVFLDPRTLIYLAGDPDGSGPWLYSIDTERRIPHRLTSGLDRYTSLAASADGRRLVLTRATPKSSLWKLRIADTPSNASAAVRIPLTTRSGFSPRLGPDYLVYASGAGTSGSIWKVAGGTATEVWSGSGARVFGGPAISSDGRHIAFSVRQRGRTLLYVMQSDGTGARIVSDSLELEGGPAWTPDGQSIISAVNDHGIPRLYRVAADGRSPTTPFVREYSLDPAWSRDGHFAVYSGPDIGAMLSVKAVAANGTAHALRPLTLTRGYRRLAFISEGRELVFLRGGMHRQDLWLVNLKTGAERQLTELGPEFDVRDFDISPDGRDVVLERVQERSEVVLLDLPGR